MEQLQSKEATNRGDEQRDRFEAEQMRGNEEQPQASHLDNDQQPQPSEFDRVSGLFEFQQECDFAEWRRMQMKTNRSACTRTEEEFGIDACLRFYRRIQEELRNAAEDRLHDKSAWTRMEHKFGEDAYHQFLEREQLLGPATGIPPWLEQWLVPAAGIPPWLEQWLVPATGISLWMEGNDSFF